MNKKSLSVSLGSSVALLVLAAGCTTTRPNVAYEHTNRPALSSYAWSPAADAKTRTKSGVADPRLSKIVHQAAEQALAAKGYTKASDDSPSFWISYDASLKQGSRTVACRNAAMDAISHYTGDDYAGATKTVPRNEGTLVLRCVSGADSTMYWQGTATDDVDLEVPVAKRHMQLSKAVESILEPFPAR
ncbi:MAG: DUF4136 domain-containing protein [Lentisphaeria bacterium]|nr:DUF4136 domain-containing protein [Lentisphaeria bacterium]